MPKKVPATKAMPKKAGDRETALGQENGPNPNKPGEQALPPSADEAMFPDDWFLD